MAKRMKSDSISEIEQELQAIKSSLKELKQEDTSSTATTQKSTTRTRRKKAVAPITDKSLSESVLTFLKEAKVQRQSNFATFWQELIAAREQRQEDWEGLQENYLQERIQRLEWVKELHLTNEKRLQEFMSRFESQCEKDRQNRLIFIDELSRYQSA